MVEDNYEEELDDTQEGYEDVDPNLMTNLRETTRAELFKEVIKPDLSPFVGLELADGKMAPLFSKELKTSFLNEHQMALVEEISDLIIHMSSIGAKAFALKLLGFRDTILSVAPSNKAMLLRLMNTEYSFKNIKTEESGGKKWFSRGGEEKWTQ